MPAGIKKSDTMMSVRETPWHGLGEVLKKPPKTIEEAVKLSGLNWEVEQHPVFAQINGKKVVMAGFKANVRMDTGQALGMVSERYKPVQNREAFSWLSSIFGSEMHFETAGSLQDGRRTWVLMKIPDFVKVGGDPIGQYAFISNGFDGNTSVTTAMTPIRIVCQNTLSCALDLAKGRDQKRTHVIRHLGDMESKIKEARNVLQITIDYYKGLKIVGDGLAKAKISEKKADQILKLIIPVDESLGDRAQENRNMSRADIMQIFKGEGRDGDTQGNAPGSWWCLYNAITEWSDWGRDERKDGGRWQRAIDDPDALKSTTWKVILDQTGIKTGSKNKAVAAF